MPSTPYDLVKDDQDLRIPLHPEQAFFHGITFQAKIIGWQEVPRPNTRTEIVQAMRRIRYECKVQNLKKRKVTIHISVDGVRVCLKKRKRKKKQWSNDADDIELLNHPIYRIFYVSHDSSDLKIFSYISRDGATDTFKCSVFKSNKKSQAMRIVRTVGQAFEVCHKFNLQKNSLENNDERSDQSSDMLEHDRISEQMTDDDENHHLRKDLIPVTPDLAAPQRPNHLEIVPQINNSNNFRKSSCGDGNGNEYHGMIGGDKSPSSPISTSREIQLLKEKLEQQAIQTKQALAQLMLVREQLISETNARIEAQARTQQLLQQNRELLEHLASIGGYTEPDRSGGGLTAANIGLAPQSSLQMFLQEQSGELSPIRKAFLTSPTNNNLSAINQQLNNLGSINQQLNTLSHQLSGLNQQSQNLQNFQNLGNVQQQQQQQQIQTANIYPNFSQIQKISNQLTNISTPPEVLAQQELYQMNQELLNRLHNLNLNLSVNSNSSNQGVNNNNGNNINNSAGHHTINNSMGNNNNSNSSPQNSFIFANPGHLSSSPNNNNNNFNFLSSPSSLGNLTPSPIGTLNRNSYSTSPMDDNLGMSIDKNLNDIEDSQFIKPLSQVGALTTLHSDGKVKVIVPISSSNSTGEYRTELSVSPSRRMLDRQSMSMMSSASSSPNTVTLKVTDETGVVTNSRKLSATPSFITRSTSEKVPNRSQIMSQLSSTVKVARWFQQLPWAPASLSRPESGFVSGDSRSEKNPEDPYSIPAAANSAREPDDFCDEYLLVEGSTTLWTKLSAKKRRKLLGMRLGKVTTF